MKKGSEVIEKDGLLYDSYTGQLFSGEVSNYSKWYGKILNGKKEGFWVRRGFDGFSNNSEEGEYVNGKREGEWKFYRGYFDQYPFSLERIENYKNNIPNGLIIHYYGNGRKKSEESVKDNINHGLKKCWYETGEKSQEINWVNGKINGSVISWFRNGNKKSESLYDNDNGLISKKEWNEDGSLKK